MGNLTVAVDEEDLPEGDPKLIVVLEYLEKLGTLGRFLWVVPDAAYRASSKSTHRKYEATLSPKVNARDRWVDYRYNVADLPWVIGPCLDKLKEKASPTRRRLGHSPARTRDRG